MSEIEQEIASQPAVWRQASSLALSAVADLPLRGQRMAVLGCGTSSFVAQVIAALWEAEGWGEADAFAASEMPAGRRYDVAVAISRSGTTTEVARALQALLPGVPSLAITGVDDSPVAGSADRSIVVGFADERSIVQTRFATAVLALFRAHLGHDVNAIADEADLALAEPLPVDPARFEHFVFLGRGWTVGLANEASLKLREAAGAWSEAYPAMEFRHGPISVAGPHSLVLAFGAVEPDLLAEVAETGATIVRNGFDPMVELVTAQRMAVTLALAKGLDPDRPRGLTRSVVLS